MLELRDAIELYHLTSDPDLFVRYVCGAIPDPDQIEILCSIRDHKKNAVASGHGVGKTALLSWAIKIFLIRHPGARIIATSNTEVQLKTRLWAELAKWVQNSLIRDYLKWTTKTLTVQGAGGDWFAEAVPWNEHNPESFQGLHGDVMTIIDEGSSIPKNIYEAIYGNLTTLNSRIAVMGNMTRNEGEFFDIFDQEKPDWQRFRIDARKNPRADKKLFADWKKEYGEDSDFFRVRVRGLAPKKGFKNFIPLDLIDSAIGRPVPFKEGIITAGFKCALYNEDNHALIIRKENRVLSTRIWSGSIDKNVLSQELADMVFSHQIDRFILNDSGLFDIEPLLKKQVDKICQVQKFRDWDAPNHDKYSESRSELWGALKIWLEESHIPEGIKNSLNAPEYYYTAQQKIQIENGDLIKKRGGFSPNLGDALAMTFLNTQSSSRTIQQNLKKCEAL